MGKRRFKLDITVAVEANDVEEAFELLTSSETSLHISEAIKASKDKIIASLNDGDFSDIDSEILEEPLVIN